MDKKDSMWKKLIRKTIGKRKEEIHKDDDVVFVKLEVNRKGIIRTLIDDHRDAAMYRHAMRSLYCKIKGDYVVKLSSMKMNRGVSRCCLERWTNL